MYFTWGLDKRNRPWTQILLLLIFISAVMVEERINLYWEQYCGNCWRGCCYKFTNRSPPTQFSHLCFNYHFDWNVLFSIMSDFGVSLYRVQVLVSMFMTASVLCWPPYADMTHDVQVTRPLSDADPRRDNWYTGRQCWDIGAISQAHRGHVPRSHPPGHSIINILFYHGPGDITPCQCLSRNKNEKTTNTTHSAPSEDRK